MFKRVLAAASIAAFALTLVGCYNGGSAPQPVQFHLRLLVANFATGGTTSNVVAYTFPLSASSAPTSTVPGSAGGPNGATGMIEDNAGDLFVANSSANSVIAYFPIVGNSSTPALTMVNGINDPQDMTFDAGLNLYVANFTTLAHPTGIITVYTPPLSGTSIPVASLINGLNGPTSVTYNGAGSIFVANKTGGTVTAYTIPVSLASTPSQTLSTQLVAPVAVGFDAAGALYVADNGNSKIEVYTGSLAGNPPPSFAITNGVNAPRYLTIANSGELYVTNASSITAYTPPFSATSAPAFTITTGLNAPVGAVVGL
jgi:hypothetical protein